MEADLAEAAAQFRDVVAECEATRDAFMIANGLQGLCFALAYCGEVSAARAAADAEVEAAAELGEYFQGVGHSALAVVALAAGDVQAAVNASEAAQRQISVQPKTAASNLAVNAAAALAGGDLINARRLADEAVTATAGWHLTRALMVRARVSIAHGEPERAERDGHGALALAASIHAHLEVPHILECLADVAKDTGNHQEAARLFGAADAIRQHTGAVRFKIYDAGYEASLAALRDTLGENDFDAAWAQGAALSTEEAIAYAQRGRGERKRPATGWASLTPAERDLVRLVSEGLANNDIATRLFVSPRTVQAHLTHVYNKLGLTSRVQLAQEAARHA